MSQNQSYFWQTTRHNVYLKRSAKLHMLLALMAVLTFSTICIAEIQPEMNDEPNVIADTKFTNDNANADVDKIMNGVNDVPNTDITKDAPKSSGTGFVDAFTASISVILFTELGDKTFFIAAIMAMRHPRLIVFSGAIFALALMTVLSVVFGMAATIIPKVYTYYISTALFAIFGLKMIYDGYVMKPGDAQEELEEVQSDLRKREDELLRGARGKSTDLELKRKNSNSDKDDEELGSNAGIAANNAANHVNITTNPAMQHRQRKHYTNNNNNNNNRGDLSDDDDDNLTNDCRESDVFLKQNANGNNNEQIKMSTFLSNPVLSSSLNSNQTVGTHCEDIDDDERQTTRSPSNKVSHNANDVLIHSQSAHVISSKINRDVVGNDVGSGVGNNLNGSKNDSLVSINSKAAAGQPNGELKQIGGSKKRVSKLSLY